MALLDIQKEARINKKSITISGRGTIGYSCIRYYPYCPIVRLLVVIPKANIDFNYLCYVFTILLEQGLGTSIPQLTVPMIKEKAIPLSPSFGAKAYCRENRKIIGTSGEIKNGKLTKNF